MQRPPRRKQRDSEPGRFMWWDLGAVLLYVGGFLLGLISLVVLVPPFSDLAASENPDDQALLGFLINAVGYGVLVIVALALSGYALWRSLKAFSYLWWLKLLLVPCIWFGIIILNMILTMIFSDDPDISANEGYIRGMFDVVPFWALLVVLGLLGPYVEEYFFRHLLVGKLSRFLNIWVCGAISVVIFALIHVFEEILTGDIRLVMTVLIPYLTMGAAFTLAYILSGRSLFYAWLLHAFNNCVSVALSYFLLPWAEDQMERMDEAETGFNMVQALPDLIPAALAGLTGDSGFMLR